MSYVKALPFSMKVYPFEPKARAFKRLGIIVKNARPFPFRF
jgi:hypothetical protein